MVWKISFTRSAEKEFSKLPHDIKKRVRDFLRDKVVENPRTHGTAIKSSSLIKLWRYRVGHYRLISQIKDKEVVVIVIKIGKRGSIYQDL